MVEDKPVILALCYVQDLSGYLSECRVRKTQCKDIRRKNWQILDFSRQKSQPKNIFI